MLVDLTQLPVAPTLHWSEAFYAWLVESGRRQNTISAYLQDMRHFFRSFNELSPSNVKAYFSIQDADNTVKPTSRNRRLASMRVFVQWAVETGQMDADPTVGIKRVEVELSPRDRSADEMAALDQVVTDQSHLRCHTEGHSFLGLRDELIWNLFKYGGLRIAEVAGLKIIDVDLDRRLIHVLGKGGKKAPVKIHHELFDVITSWLDRAPSSVGGFLVTDAHGQGITTSQIRRRIQLMGEKAGVSNLKPHDLRHTCAYNLLETYRSQGMSDAQALNAVRKHMRHGDGRTTNEYYLQPRDSKIWAGVEAM